MRIRLIDFEIIPRGVYLDIEVDEIMYHILGHLRDHKLQMAGVSFDTLFNNNCINYFDDLDNLASFLSKYTKNVSKYRILP